MNIKKYLYVYCETRLNTFDILTCIRKFEKTSMCLNVFVLYNPRFSKHNIT